MSITKISASALQADPRLKKYFESEEQRRAVTQSMFDEAANDYDRAEKMTGLGCGSWYRREVLRRNGVKHGMYLLDVAAGTGLVSIEGARLIGPNGRLIALDPSPGMLDELRNKIQAETIEAYAESIPLPENHVDFISMGYALRHIGDIDKAFCEFLRVLRPGGKVCLMEISKPKGRIAQFLLRNYIGRVVPFMYRFAGNRTSIVRLWKYYGETIQSSVSPDSLIDALRRNGFSDVQCHVTFGIFREYIGVKSITA